MQLKEGDHILFYGDSITDGGRRQQGNNNGGLGSAYPAIVAARLKAEMPELDLTVTNTGISGNRVVDLAERLEADCLAHKPTIVSILVGINDTWRAFDSGLESPVAEFQECYRGICTRITEQLRARLVILEPFVLHVKEGQAGWRTDLGPRIDAVREVAREFSAVYVPLDGLFAAAACRAPAAYWAADGVHPTVAGHGLIAQAWLDAVVD